MKGRRKPLLDRRWPELLREASSFRDLAASLNDLLVEDGEVIHVAVLGSAGSVAASLAERDRPGLRPLIQGDDLCVFSYTRTVGRRRKRRYNGEFAICRWDSSAAHLVLYCGTPSFIRHALDPLIESLYPEVVVPFLSQDELHNVIKAVQRRAQPDTVRIHEYSAKRRIRSVRRRFESVRDWTDVEPDVAFREAKERNVWFSSVRFLLVRRSSEERTRWSGSRYRLSKYGSVSCDGGFELVTDSVIPLLTAITSDRVRFFSNRERSAQARDGLRPLEISYDRPVLTSSPELKRLLDVLRKYPHGTCTVLHANPYLHVTLVDDLDLSAADVWVLSERGILLIPQLRASHGALKRLVNHIFENFGEGHIGEPKTH